MHMLESLETCMVDSSYWTIPESESVGCQLGIPEDISRDQKQNGHWRQLLNVLGNIFASKPLFRNTILVTSSMLLGSRNQMMLNKRCLYDTLSR